jgi:hypothetical protein
MVLLFFMAHAAGILVDCVLCIEIEMTYKPENKKLSLETGRSRRGLQ